MKPATKTTRSTLFNLLLFTTLLATPETPPVSHDGKQLFANYCSACHQSDGSGTEDGPPPLADSPWIKGPKQHLIRIVLGGLHGPIIVNQKVYDLEMPSFGDILGDSQVASILTHVRQAFAEGPLETITAQDVAKYRSGGNNRKGYWNVPELLDTPEIP